MWRIKTTKDGVWLGRWILHSATQFHPFSTLPWDDQYPLHHRAIDQSLREGGRHVEIRNPLDIGGLIDWREQARALEIGGDDLSHAVRNGQIRADEIRDRDRQRLKVAGGDLDSRRRGARPEPKSRGNAGNQRERATTSNRRKSWIVQLYH